MEIDNSTIKESNLKPRNFPERVSAFERSLNEAVGNPKSTLRAFLKKARSLERRSKHLLEDLELKGQEYKDSFGEDVVEKKKETLETLPAKIQEAIRERTEYTANRNIERLRDMGYSH